MTNGDNRNGMVGDNQRQPQGTTSGDSPDYSPTSHPNPAGPMTTHQAAHVAGIDALLQEMRARALVADWPELSAWADQVADLMKQQGWQPIATAPKDGSVILAFDGRDQVVTAFDERFGWKHQGGYPAVTGKLTHWQPLPAAPTEASR